MHASDARACVAAHTVVLMQMSERRKQLARQQRDDAWLEGCTSLAHRADVLGEVATRNVLKDKAEHGVPFGA